MPAEAAQVIRQLVRRNREEIRLQVAGFVVVGQAIQEADERLLNDVLGGRAVVQAALDKCQQSALVPLNQTVPGPHVAAADLLDQQTVAFTGHARTSRPMPQPYSS